MNKIDILSDIAFNKSWDFLDDYSGRGMYGAKCAAIIGPNPNRIIEAAAAKGITGAVVDNMGLDYVVYWPGVRD